MSRVLLLASIFSVTQSLGYPVVFGAVAIEAIGVPLPGEIALILGAAAAGNGRLSIVLVIALAALAATLGGAGGFAIGRFGGRTLLERPGRFERERRRVIEIGDPFFAKWGARAVFIARWITGLRTWGAWLAGASDMPWSRFLIFNTAGSVCWALTWGLAAYFGGKGVEHIASEIGIYAAAVAVLAIAVFAFLAHRRMTKGSRTSSRSS